MQLTLYSKAVDDGYPPIPSTTQSTIYTNLTSTPVFDYLRVSKFLSEFTTEVDKARVRKNLGIPDEYSYNWGHIGGSIEHQLDLAKILDSLTKELLKHYSLILGINSTIVDLRGLIGEGTDSHINSIYKTIESFHKDLLALQINVALNSTDITRLSGGNIVQGGNGSVDSTILSQVATNKSDIEQLKTRVNILEGNAGGSGDGSDFSSILSRIELLETAIKTNTISKLEITPSSGIKVDSIESGEQSVLVICYYTKIDPVDVTSECVVNSSNGNVATWNNTTKKVKINGVGTATLTFMFRSKTITLKVTVGELEKPVVIPQWVGYANTWEDLVTKSSVDSVAGTWTSTTPGCLDIATNPIYIFWIVTTQNIRSISESVGEWDINSTDHKYKTTVINGKTYTIYKSKPITTSSLQIKIVV